MEMTRSYQPVAFSMRSNGRRVGIAVIIFG
jgi:hypothetical protein